MSRRRGSRKALEADGFSVGSGRAASSVEQAKADAAFDVCCPVWWKAKHECTAWFEYNKIAGPLHGCGKAPGHSGQHRCPCGARKPQS